MAFKYTEIELAYGSGLQINPVENSSIDVTYEHTKLSFEDTNLKI